MELSSLAHLQKQSKKSFNDQKTLIKKVLAGKEVKCRHCQQLLQFELKTEAVTAKVYCQKGCTDIELDIS
ncbi:hypothetical protein HII17_17320 [Thalassotalea sp. M1531]|uniref:Uncharacterized protein n=1 Tax=Thalassotalea algicola TaxID=2716224 RepID=A0A7Y0Q8V4_9GAMM|nr:hypothetical protein [Thalassotalea algicola]NMP33317.1 hypothetical protein [Thalassotalea algicola]